MKILKKLNKKQSDNKFILKKVKPINQFIKIKTVIKIKKTI